GSRPRRAAHLRADARLREPPRPVLGGDGPHGRAPRQLPPGLHPPRPHQRRHQPGPGAGRARAALMSAAGVSRRRFKRRSPSSRPAPSMGSGPTRPEARSAKMGSGPTPPAPTALGDDARRPEHLEAETFAFYRASLEALNADGAEYLVGGAYAFARYTGI